MAERERESKGGGSINITHWWWWWCSQGIQGREERICFSTEETKEAGGTDGGVEGEGEGIGETDRGKEGW